jgi:hypothetical protein
VFGSGGPTESTVATIDNAGDAQFLGTLELAGQATFNASAEIKNNADAENDFVLWSGLTAPQKEMWKARCRMWTWSRIRTA